MLSAMRSASVGPATMSVMDTRMKNASPSVRAMAMSRTFHHGRLSTMS